MVSYEKWNTYDVDAELENLQDGDEPDPEGLDEDLDALQCTIHGKKFKSGGMCPKCRIEKKKASAPVKGKGKTETKETKQAKQEPAKKKEPEEQVLVDLTQPEKLKEEGNKLVSTENWTEAAQSYTSALGLLPTSKIHQTQAVAIRALRLALNLNLAHTALKQELWDQAVGFCTAALEIEPKNRKALFRRGSALSKKNTVLAKANAGELKRACKDLDDALAGGPQSAEIRRELDLARERYEALSIYEREHLGIDRLKKDIEDMPDEQVSIPAMLKQMETMARQLPGSSFAKAMDDIRTGKAGSASK